MRVLFICLLIGLFFIPAQAQIEGLWTVKQVSVGDEMMTPVAKWFQLLPSGELRSGNGGIVNMRGNWSYDEQAKQVQFFDEQQVADPAGPFSVVSEEDKMYWKREEEGMLVEVMLLPANQLPKGPWDKILGAWELKEAPSDATFPFSSVYFRWDNGLTFQASEGRGRQGGIWQIHGHRPELRIILMDENATQSKWAIHFEDKQMYWEGSGANQPIRLVWSQ